jgi:hypothetical protein
MMKGETLPAGTAWAGLPARPQEGGAAAPRVAAEAVIHVA